MTDVRILATASLHLSVTERNSISILVIISQTTDRFPAITAYSQWIWQSIVV